MKKKYLTLDDLYQFYFVKNENIAFSAKESGGTIVVHVDDMATATFEQTDDTEGLFFLKLKVCHTGINRNHSKIKDETMEKAMPSLKYRPILAHIVETSDGELDFNMHDIEVDEDGNATYIEKQVGSFTADEPYLEYDKDNDKNYVIAYAAIPEEYTETANIIRRKKGTKVSCELTVNELSYSTEDKVLVLEDIRFSGCTLLGESVGEGMIGSRADEVSFSDFSVESNSTCKQHQDSNALVEVLGRLNTTLSGFNNKEILGEGGNKSVDKLNELLAKYNVNQEDLTFEIEGLTDEELETKFIEVFEDEGGNGDPELGSEEDDNPDDIKDTEIGSDDGSTKKKKTDYEVVCSIEIDGHSYSLKPSLDEVIYALSSLVNSTYSEQDNTYYSVKVYDKYVIMIDYWNNKAYKQNYSSTDNDYALSGDRVEVFAQYLTQDEINALDELKENYAQVSEKLQSYQTEEAKALKEQILTDESFSSINQTEDFETFSKDVLAEGNENKYSVENVQSKCDSLLLEYAKANATSFSTEVKKVRKIKSGAQREETYSPYGSLFKDKTK